MTDARVAERVVAVAHGDYAVLTKLERAVPDAQAFVDVMRRHEFDCRLLPDQRRGALLDAIDETLPESSSPRGTLILSWIGHGELGADTRLRLMGRTTDTADEEVADAAKLGEWAARTGASQILVILDCCFSGRGVPDALAMASAVLAGRADVTSAWFGCLAASRGDERARSGALSRELTRLLEHGPADERLQQIWRLNSERIRGDWLMEALVEEWPEARQTLQKATIGNGLPMVPNPLYRPTARNAVVEHLLQAARGTSTAQNFFTGRAEILARMVAWMTRRQPGLCVVTGPAGSGKSALVGRVVSLSAPAEREQLLRDAVADELDPGESSVDANVHLRQLTVKTAAEELASQLGLPAEAGPYDVLALASRRRADGQPLVIALDGLDEAGDIECRDIAVQLAAPLSREALVLIGTREVPGPVGEPGLLALLAPAAETIDLAMDVQDTLRDVREYAARRLRDVSPTMDPEAVADELVAVSHEANPAQEGPFLLVRMITSQLRAEPVDTSGDDWRSRLASSVEAAFEADLSRCVLEIDGYEHPTAARELMRALACAYGGGFPADDVWPAVATAMSPTGTIYKRDSVYALLFKLGRHIVTDTERDQAVFRVAHQRLVDNLRPVVGVSPWQSLAPMVAQPIAQAISALYERLLDEGQEAPDHAYLWRFAWQHLADAGTTGIDLLRRLVDRDREAFLPDLAVALMRVAHTLLGLGEARKAAERLEECVGIYQDLDQPLERAEALSQLALARNFAGDAAGADEAADEALQLIRRSSDDPSRRWALGVTLMAQALAQMRQGLPRAALGLAKEAIEIFEGEAAAGNDGSQQIASMYVLASSAALGLGDVEQADELSRLALEALEGEETEDYLLIEALAGRAQAELQVVARHQGRDDFRPVAGAQLMEVYRRTGATGTIADTTIAEGLRIYAVTLTLPGADDQTAPEPRELLDEAVQLVLGTADVSCDAALSLGASLMVRAALDAADDADPLGDLEAAQRALSRFAPSSPVAAGQLGIAIAREVAILAAAEDADLERLIERQQNAVDLLWEGGTPVRGARCDALESLYRMLLVTGRTDEADFALESVVNERRELPAHSAEVSMSTAASLAELAGRMVMTRPLEAIELATEAVQLLEPIDADSVDLLTAQAQLNIGAANALLKRWDAARGPLEQAAALLEAAPASVPVARLHAAALTNLARVRLAADETEASVDAARSALALVDEHGPGPNIGLMASARVSLGLALRAAGDQPAAGEQLAAAIADLRERKGPRDQVIGPLAEALNAADGDVWEVVLAELEDEPEFAQGLSVLRERPPGEMAGTVEDIRRALEGAAADTLRLRTIHQLVRARRREDPEGFDAAWRADGEAVADWMTIPLSLELTVLAWWNTPTWRQSRDYLLHNPDILDPASDTILEEMRNEDSADLVDRHLRLRAESAAHGAEQAYAPVLSELLLGEWSNSGLDEDFLTQHYSELLSSEVADVVAALIAEGESEVRLLDAVLVLARHGEERVAYRVLDDPTFGATLLEPAWRSVDFERLAAIATLCRDVASTEEEPGRLATVALAIAYALMGDRDGAMELIREVVAAVPGQPERAPLSAAVSDALAHHQEHHAALIELLQALHAGSAETPS